MTKNEYHSRIEMALLIAEGGDLSDPDHKAHIIDQMIRALTGCQYEEVTVTLDGGDEVIRDALNASEGYTRWVTDFETDIDGEKRWTWPIGAPQLFNSKANEK